MTNSLYQSILMKMSSISPLFSKVILDRALKKILKTPENVTAIDLLNLIHKEINPQFIKSKANNILLAGSGYFITDKNNKIVYTNSFAKKMLETILLNKLKDEDEVEFLIKIKIMKDIKNCQELEIYELEHPFNKDLFYNIHHAPMFLSGNIITGVMTIIQDVTLMKQLEKEVIIQTHKLSEEIKQREMAELKLIENQQALIQTSKLAALGEMSSGIAHEINNPLSVIGLNIHYLQKKLNQTSHLDTNSAEKFESIEKNLKRIEKIIKSMKRITYANRPEEISKHSLDEIINDTLILTEQKFKNKMIDYQYPDLLELKKYFVEINLSEMQQVYINLINNAEDAVSELHEKWIHVKFTLEDKFYVLSVCDSGKIQSLEIINKMFEPFFTSKEVGKGTGMGLSLSKKIMQSHKGDLIYRHNAKTTQFDILIPRN
jgi:signal transduction histidine kinase